MTPEIILPIVHLVDTEGPLNETLDATFESLYRVFGVRLEPTAENLAMIQRGESIPPELAPAIVKKFSKHRLSYNRNWDDIGAMCQTLFDPYWRNKFKDSFGNPYAINWCCVDFLGFQANPRQRQMGPNFSHRFYSQWIKQSGTTQDRLYWHYHPIAFSRAAHHSGTNLNHFPHHYTSLCHRILDCHDFPAVFRPGYHMERVDLNVFLEQWIPFDYANQNVSGRQESTNYGRFQNWDGAPVDWTVYHPSFGDARKNGSLRRRIARCLNIGTDFSLLTEQEIDLAFTNASKGMPVILSYADHDERDMISEVEQVASLIKQVAKRYAGVVSYQYCNAVEAMRICEGLRVTGNLKFDVKIKRNRISVKVNKELFGPQPFLAIRSKAGEVFHDNFCLGEDERSFFYIFDEDSIPIESILEIGIAGNDTVGTTAVWVMNLKTNETMQTYTT